MLSLNERILDFGFWILDFGFWIDRKINIDTSPQIYPWACIHLFFGQS